MKRAIKIPFPTLLTNRLVLRQLELADAASILALRSDPRVNRFVVRPPITELEDAIRFIHRINRSVTEGECLFWAIVPKQSEDLIGTICLWNWENTHNQTEIGFELLPEWQGKGLMQEAVSRITEFAFIDLKFQKIEAWIHPENRAAVNLIVKCGYKIALNRLALPTDGSIVIYCKCNT